MINGEQNPAATYGEALNTFPAATTPHSVKPYQSYGHEHQRQFGKPASSVSTQIVSIDGEVVYTESFPGHVPFNTQT